MGFVATAEADIESILGKVDLPTLIAAGQSLVAALPAVRDTLAADMPNILADITAIEAAFSGKTPTDTDWAALDAQLDANDADIANSGAAAQAELDRRGGGTS